mmetsp:Transcript_27312/g.78645  ORF Transcript_27312/g.78645 Transcript_27312/m.78645 type:complete len:200 (+) Transcript_27312:200-799(+)
MLRNAAPGPLLLPRNAAPQRCAASCGTRNVNSGNPHHAKRAPNWHCVRLQPPRPAARRSRLRPAAPQMPAKEHQMSSGPKARGPYPAAPPSRCESISPSAHRLPPTHRPTHRRNSVGPRSSCSRRRRWRRNPCRSPPPPQPAGAPSPEVSCREPAASAGASTWPGPRLQRLRRWRRLGVVAPPPANTAAPPRCPWRGAA